MSTLPRATYIPPKRVLIISYDLKGVAAAYTAFYDALKAQGEWWHYLADTWLIYTASTPEQLYAAIRPHLLQTDNVFIGTLTKGFFGQLPQDAWEWLTARGYTVH